MVGRVGVSTCIEGIVFWAESVDVEMVCRLFSGVAVLDDDVLIGNVFEMSRSKTSHTARPANDPGMHCDSAEIQGQ